MKKKCLLLFSSALVGTSMLSAAIAAEKDVNGPQFVIEIEANRHKGDNKNWDSLAIGKQAAPDIHGTIQFLGREYQVPLHKNTYRIKRAFPMADLEPGTPIHIQFYDRDRYRSDDAIAVGTVKYPGRPTVSAIGRATIRLQYYPPAPIYEGPKNNKPNTQSATVVITAANAKQIAREVYSAQAILSGAGGQSRGSSKWICKTPTQLQQLIGAGDLTVWLFRNIGDNAKDLYNSANIINRLKKGVGKLECDNAAQGGGFETSLDFAKDHWWEEVSAKVNFDKCRVKIFNGAVTAAGNMGLTSKQDNGTYRLEAGFNDTRLMLPNGHHFYSIDGGYSVALVPTVLWPPQKMTLQMEIQGTQLKTDFGDIQCHSNEKDNGAKLSDFTMTLDINAAKNAYACTYEGILFSVPLAGSVRYKTTVAFKGKGSDYPHTGTLEIFGKRDAQTGRQPKLTLRAGRVRVSLDVDVDGNNSPETTQVYSWDDLLNKL